MMCVTLARGESATQNEFDVKLEFRCQSISMFNTKFICSKSDCRSLSGLRPIHLKSLERKQKEKSEMSIIWNVIHLPNWKR